MVKDEQLAFPQNIQNHNISLFTKAINVKMGKLRKGESSDVLPRTIIKKVKFGKRHKYVDKKKSKIAKNWKFWS